MARFINFSPFNFASERPTNFRIGFAPHDRTRKILEHRDYLRAKRGWEKFRRAKRGWEKFRKAPARNRY